MDKNVSAIYHVLQDLSWYFGNQGFDGECCEDLSLVEYMALKKIRDQQNIPVQRLGDTLNISKSGISKIIDRLEKKNYVSREKSVDDGRVCCILLTKNGMDALNKITEHYAAYLEEVLGEVDKATLENITESLSLLYGKIQEKGFINND